jgi:hypothetical protein
MLRRHRHECLTASQVGLAAATDDALTVWAAEHAAVVVSTDREFSRSAAGSVHEDARAPPDAGVRHGTVGRREVTGSGADARATGEGQRLVLEPDRAAGVPASTSAAGPLPWMSRPSAS